MKLMTRTTAMLFLLSLAAVGAAEIDSEPRQSLTAQGNGITRGGVVEGDISFDEFDRLQTEGSRTSRVTTSLPEKGGDSILQSAGNSSFWFYEADVELFADFDRDGYYYGIDLLFDVDTIYLAADVYAVIYLSYEFGPWNEYAVTDDFTVLGSASSDAYTVETELVSGYPTGSYDILIELFDAYDDAYLASFGPEDTSELAYLPLEDSTRDVASTGAPQVVVNSGGGGSLSWLLLLGLLAVRMTFRPHAARLSK
jgi:hypothetical protein